MTIYSVFAINQEDEVISLYFGSSLDQARYEYDLYNRSKETRGLKEIHLSQTMTSNMGDLINQDEKDTYEKIIKV